MRSKKAQINQLQKQLKSLAQHTLELETANSALHVHAETLEELVKQRNALLRMLERVAPDCAQQQLASMPHLAHPEAQLLPDDVLHALPPPEQPTAALTASIDDALYRSIAGLTPAAAADFWLERVKDVALAMRLHERDACAAQPLLEGAVTRAMRWVRALHIFHPRIVYALHDYNLLTRRYEPPPPQHWAAALRASAPTPQQVAATRAMLSVVRPRLERLEARKQQLLEELCSLDQPGGSSAAGGSSDAAAASCETQQQAGSSGCTSSSNSRLSDSGTFAQHSASPNPLSSSIREAELEGMPARLQRRQELVQQLASNHAAWRTTSQMRAHWLTASFTYAQLGTAILGAFPYVPHGAPVFDRTAAPAAAPST